MVILSPPLTLVRAGDRRRCCCRRAEAARRRVPGHVGRPAARRRGGRRGRRGGHRRAGRQGLRAGGARAAPPRRRGAAPLRAPGPGWCGSRPLFTPTLQAIPALGPGRRCSPSAAGWRSNGEHHARARSWPSPPTWCSWSRPVRMLAGALRRRPAGPRRRPSGSSTSSTPTPLVVERARRRRPRRRSRGEVALRGRALRLHPRANRCSTASTCTSRAGEIVALVGASGSGKSTVTRCCCPASTTSPTGRVTIDGVDVRDVTLDSLRRQVGRRVRGRLPVLRLGPRQHRLRPPRRHRRRVRAAAAAAGADGFIAALPDGYDTVVGERGLTLSGGQRQRIALARAILTDPPVLVLDDATSAVDAATEEADPRHACASSWPDRTTILIAHRRSTLRLADRIVVLDGGRVVDEGTHEELLASSRGLPRPVRRSGEDIDRRRGEEDLDGEGLARAARGRPRRRCRTPQSASAGPRGRRPAGGHGRGRRRTPRIGSARGGGAVGEARAAWRSPPPRS